MKATDSGHRCKRQFTSKVYMILSGLVLMLFASVPASASYSPITLTYTYLLYSVGYTPGVSVGQPGMEANRCVIRITVKNPNQRLALATVLASSISWSNVRVKVVDPQGKVQQPAAVQGTVSEKLARIKLLFQAALARNSYYATTATVNEEGGCGVFPIFDAALIQFSAANDADYYRNDTFVAADLFRIVLNSTIGGISINPSTQKKTPSQ